ncbi:MAG TPA: DUF559 domain-containing protein [Jatrophihabitantaceae bacterium]|nr:DUF559 domain-containing protein [Jatrophihabitantaceae bacterium]
MPRVVILDDARTVSREEAIVASWPWLPAEERRAPLLVATRERQLDLTALSISISRATRLAGVAELRELLAAIVQGCRSELELWGYNHVFDVPDLRDAVRQLAVRLGRTSYYLDMAFIDEKLAVELDGRKYHASPKQWERDIARDLALAKIGWQTIRLSHRRLTTDPEGCRRDVLRVRAARHR